MRWLACIWLLCFPSPAEGQSDTLTIDILNVEQADMAVIRTPDGQWIVIDAGRGDSTALGILQERYQTQRIALLVGSHRHQDHIGGIPEIVRVLPVERYVGDTGRTADRSIVTTMLRRRLGQRRVPVHGPGADTLMVGEVRIILLPQPPRDANENNNSIVVRLEYDGFSMLFPGDAEHEAQHWLMGFYADLLDVDVLKASHHGANNGVSAEWLDATSPEAVLISAGVHYGYRHPHGEAVEDYGEIVGGALFCTNRHGNIRVVVVADAEGFDLLVEDESTRSCAFDGTGPGE